jgi:hypothetical protein
MTRTFFLTAAVAAFALVGGSLAATGNAFAKGSGGHQHGGGGFHRSHMAHFGGHRDHGRRYYGGRGGSCWQWSDNTNDYVWVCGDDN